MNNWFESSPARSVIIHTLVVAGAMWAAFTFLFDENKIAVFRAQAENEKATAGQYKAKTEVLEAEISRLRDENKKYETWLTATPATIPYFEAKLKVLTDENSRLKQDIVAARSATQDPAASSSETIARPYATSKVLSLGEAFVDPKTSATIGIGVISPNFTANGTISLPGKKPQELGSIRSGDNWSFAQGGKRYQLTVVKIDWFSNKAEVVLRELPKEK